MSRISRRDLAVSLAFAAVGAVGVWIATRRGAGLSPDSASYRAMAAYFHRHPSSLTLPPDGPSPVVGASLRHWGSFVGVVLAAMRGAGIGILDGARYLAVGVVVALILLTFWIIRRHARLAIAAFATAVVLTSSGLAAIIGSLASDGPYVALLLAALLCVDVGFDSERGAWWMGAAGLAGTASAMTRLVGIGLVVVLAVAIIVLSSAPQRRRNGAAFAITGLLSSGAWIVAYGSDRDVSFHPPTGRVNESLRTVASWVVPDPVLEHGVGRVLSGPVALALVVGVAAALVLVARRWMGASPTGRQRTVALVASVGVAYLGAILASQTFLDDAIPGNQRIFLPAYVCLVVVGALELEGVWSARAWDRSTTRIAGAVATAWLGVFVAQAAHDVVTHSRDGMGYTAAEYRESPTLGSVRKLAAGAAVYTNGRTALYLLQGRVAGPAFTASPGSGRVYRREMAQMLSRLRATDGIVIFLDTEANRVDLPPAKALEATPGLEVRARYRDGVVFGPAD